MLGVTRLLCGTVTPGDALRFGRLSGELPPHLLHYSQDKKPVIAWNVTRRCNLHCAHCYTDSFDREYEGELTTEEAKAVIDDLAAFGVPVILFSGGEPLIATRPAGARRAGADRAASAASFRPTARCSSTPSPKSYATSASPTSASASTGRSPSTTAFAA